MPESSLSVFVSCGSTYTDRQEKFVRRIEAYLKAHGCIPTTVGRNLFLSRQPVESARDLIAGCHGAVVIAFERTRIVSGLEKPGAADQKRIRNEAQPTVWNHMEAAMAYAQRVPLLIIVENGLMRQGMLSKRLEWKSLETDMSPDYVDGEEFQQTFSHWLSLVKSRQASESPSVLPTEKWRLKDVWNLLVGLEIKAALMIAAFIISVLGVTASVSFKLGEWRAQQEHVAKK